MITAKEAKLLESEPELTDNETGSELGPALRTYLMKKKMVTGLLQTLLAVFLQLLRIPLY